MAARQAHGGDSSGTKERRKPSISVIGGPAASGFKLRGRLDGFGEAFMHAHRNAFSTLDSRMGLTKRESVQRMLQGFVTDVLSVMGYTEKSEGPTLKGSLRIHFDTPSGVDMMVIIPKSDLSIILAVPCFDGDVSKSGPFQTGELNSVIKSLNEKGISLIHVVGWSGRVWPTDMMPRPRKGSGPAQERLIAIIPATGILQDGKAIAYCETFKEAKAVLSGQGTAKAPSPDAWSNESGYLIVELADYAKRASEENARQARSARQSEVPELRALENSRP